MVIESKLSRVFLCRRNLWRKVYCSCNCGVIMLRARRTTDAFSPIRRIRGLRGARFEANYVSRIDISFFFFFSPQKSMKIVINVQFRSGGIIEVLMRFLIIFQVSFSSPIFLESVFTEEKLDLVKSFAC